MMKTLLVLIAFISVPLCHAGTLNVKVSDNQNKHLAGAIVYLESAQLSSQHAGDEIATMDQINRQFSPYILAVQKGQTVSFPNSDSIKHHVYSFSPSKVFELQLFKNKKAQSISFDKPGIVELGCNIHDWMLGYIFVADNPYYGQTDKSGQMALTAPDGNYFIRVWHPRLQAADADKKQVVNLSGKQDITLQLTETLAPGEDDFGTDVDEFSEYE